MSRPIEYASHGVIERATAPRGDSPQLRAYYEKRIQEAQARFKGKGFRPELFKEQKQMLDQLLAEADADLRASIENDPDLARERLTRRERSRRTLDRLLDNERQLSFIDRVALHEAAHAFALWLEQVPINEVAINFDDASPRCTGGHVLHNGVDEDGDAASVSLAGIAAERVAGLPAMGGTDDDMAKARLWVGTGPDSAKRINAKLDALEVQLRKNWTGIRALANELKVQLVMSGREAESVLVAGLSRAAA